MSFKKVTVLGPGLLGGSVALAAQEAGLETVLWGRSQERVEKTCALGLQATTDLADAVSRADLVILAMPVGAMSGVVTKMIPHLPSGCLVTDVGSVKVLPHAEIGPLLEKAGVSFIGSHPMAGSEQTGIEAASADLLAEAACVLTNDEKAGPSELAALQEFWTRLGCRVCELGAEEHDRAVARISHYPHAMAVLTAEVGLALGDPLRLAGGGFRDTSRVASGDPAMWAEIMIENRDALGNVLREAQHSLRDMLVILEESDNEGLQQYLTRVKAARDEVS